MSTNTDNGKSKIYIEQKTLLPISTSGNILDEQKKTYNVFDLMIVGIIKNLLNSKPGLLKFLRTTLSARWNGKSTNGRIGNENNQNRFIAEKIKIRINDILSALVNN